VTEPEAVTDTSAAVESPAEAVDRNRTFNIEALRSMYALSGLEAEHVYALANGVGDRAALDEAVKQVRSLRVVYRQRWEAVDPRLGHAGSVIVNSAPDTEDGGRFLADIPGETTTGVTDNTQPESGPHGPYADYHSATVTDSEIAERTGIDPAFALPLATPKETE
jgi:hypothetical protein